MFLTDEVFELSGEAELKYKGCGRVWAALKDEKVIDLIYMSFPAKYIQKKDKRFKSGFREIRVDNREEFGMFREQSKEHLSKIGDSVKAGMLSCRQFLTEIK